MKPRKKLHRVQEEMVEDISSSAGRTNAKLVAEELEKVKQDGLQVVQGKIPNNGRFEVNIIRPLKKMGMFKKAVARVYWHRDYHWSRARVGWQVRFSLVVRRKGSKKEESLHNALVTNLFLDAGVRALRFANKQDAIAFARKHLQESLKFLVQMGIRVARGEIEADLDFQKRERERLAVKKLKLRNLQNLDSKL